MFAFIGEGILEPFYWLFFVVVCIGTATGFVFALVHAIALYGPKFDRLMRGERGFVIDYSPCCPAGIGCNDNRANRECRRLLAEKIADPEERMALEMAWADYCAKPSQGNLDGYAAYRDSLIHSKLMDAEFLNLLDGRPQLVERVSGTVEPKRKRSGVVGDYGDTEY